MKTEIKILLSALMFSLLISCAGTQDLAPDGSKIPIGTNTIIVKSEKSIDETYKNIGSFLIQNGYSIKNSTPEFHSVTTEFKDAEAGIMEAKASISITVSVAEGEQQSNIILTASGKSMYSNFSVEQKGATGSAMRIAWDEFYSLVKSYSSNLSFERK